MALASSPQLWRILAGSLLLAAAGGERAAGTSTDAAGHQQSTSSVKAEGLRPIRIAEAGVEFSNFEIYINSSNLKNKDHICFVEQMFVEQ